MTSDSEYRRRAFSILGTFQDDGRKFSDAWVHIGRTFPWLRNDMALCRELRERWDRRLRQMLGVDQDAETAPEPLYRVMAPGEMLDTRTMLASRTCWESTRKPQDEHSPVGEWYCPSGDCVVREVHVLVKLLDSEDSLPQMRCPACGSLLSFHHWLAATTLIPAGEGH